MGLIYQWYDENDAPISGATGPCYAVTAAPELCCTHYFCTVTNDFETVTSDDGYLWVVDAATGCTGAYGSGKYAKAEYKVCGVTGAPSTVDDTKKHYYALRKIWPMPGMEE